jgi:hypothetical protein
MIAINFNNPDKAKVSRNLIVALNDELKSLIEYWTDDEGIIIITSLILIIFRKLILSILFL